MLLVPTETVLLPGVATADGVVAVRERRGVARCVRAMPKLGLRLVDVTVVVESVLLLVVPKLILLRLADFVCVVAVATLPLPSHPDDDVMDDNFAKGSSNTNDISPVSG